MTETHTDELQLTDKEHTEHEEHRHLHETVSDDQADKRPSVALTRSDSSPSG